MTFYNYAESFRPPLLDEAFSQYKPANNAIFPLQSADARHAGAGLRNLRQPLSARGIAIAGGRSQLFATWGV